MITMFTGMVLAIKKLASRARISSRLSNRQQLVQAQTETFLSLDDVDHRLLNIRYRGKKSISPGDDKPYSKKAASTVDSQGCLSRWENPFVEVIASKGSTIDWVGVFTRTCNQNAVKGIVGHKEEEWHL